KVGRKFRINFKHEAIQPVIAIDFAKCKVLFISVSSAGTVIAVKIGITDMLGVFLFQFTQVHGKIALIHISITCRAGSFYSEHFVVIDEFTKNGRLYLLKEKYFVL